MVKAKLDKNEVIISMGTFKDIYKPLGYKIVNESKPVVKTEKKSTK